jgi:hypothetical protein
MVGRLRAPVTTSMLIGSEVSLEPAPQRDSVPPAERDEQARRFGRRHAHATVRLLSSLFARWHLK